MSFHLQDYDCIPQGKTSTSKGGLILYVDDQYNSKVTFNLNIYEHWEVRGDSKSTGRFLILYRDFEENINQMSDNTKLLIHVITISQI